MIILRGVAMFLGLAFFLILGAGIALLAESFRRRNDWKHERIIHVPCRLCEPPDSGWFNTGECPLCDGEGSILLSESQESPR